MGTSFAWSPDVVSLLTHWALPFLVVLGVLVAFHEMGHFLAARWVGVKVLKFSLGFGPKIFGRQFGETEYLLSVVPLGGYVKLFGEDEHETLTPEDKKRAFVHQSLWGKTLIVAGMVPPIRRASYPSCRQGNRSWSGLKNVKVLIAVRSSEGRSNGIRSGYRMA